jgi:hypothetical protein
MIPDPLSRLITSTGTAHGQPKLDKISWKEKEEEDAKEEKGKVCKSKERLRFTGFMAPTLCLFIMRRQDNGPLTFIGLYTYYFMNTFSTTLVSNSQMMEYIPL